ncbi:hypothetical protein PQQ63_15440 [Paraburkholderia metrosideri]|uniref:Uncharacterized protein n=1 Tax=Paraburkholderia metrosideri TaxID=580937 RepID=A0ABW9DRX0_9BURK
MTAGIIGGLIAALVALGLDWLQTLAIARNPAKWAEVNIVLGRHPTVSGVCWYFGACVALVALLTGLLWWSGLPGLALGLCVLVAVFEAGVVWRNYRLGLKA